MRPPASAPRLTLAALAILAMTVAPCRAAAADAALAFTAANEHYAAGRYEEAALAYQQLLASGVASSAVHYNLGNARFRAGQLGEAILHYEKASKLDPGDPEIRSNLEFARSQTVDRTSPAGAQTPALFMERLLALTSLDVDAAILSGLWIVAGMLSAIAIAARGSALRRAAVWGLALVALPLALVAGVVAVKGWRELTVTEAVVLRERLDVMSGPAEDQTTLFTVHEGLKVRLQSRQGGWAQIVLSNGLNGWIPSDAAGII